MSASSSPTSPWGIPFEEADAWGAGAGGGEGDAFLVLAGLGAGGGVAALATAGACDCFAAAGEFELLSLLPPQLATPTARRRIAAPLARKVIGLLRFMVFLRSVVGAREVACREAACRRP